MVAQLPQTMVVFNNVVIAWTPPPANAVLPEIVHPWKLEATL
jgi:hypothetical protein